MLGVEAKGNERLYEYRPEEFYWEVVEFKDGDLNEAEKNNIKYYNQGQGLFICGSRRMQIYVICTNEELDSFGSGGGL